MDKNKSIFERYRALFALRNIGSDEAVEVLCEALHDVDSGAVFTHEIAYVMGSNSTSMISCLYHSGQMQHKGAAEALKIALKDPRLNAMVRHEAAEALGSIADDEVKLFFLQNFPQKSLD